MDTLKALKLFKQNEAAFMTKANLWEAMVIILSEIEHMLADTAGQLFNRTIIAIWDKRCDVHNRLLPFTVPVPPSGNHIYKTS
jgi:hypothetical protein